MKKIYIDANIIIDFFANRQPFCELSRKIFKLAENGNLEIFCNTHSLATAHYVLKKIYTEDLVREKISALLNYMNLVAVDAEIIQKSLKSQHKDFEDAIQIFCAHQIKNIDAIITRNLKDFSTSEITVFAPDEFLNLQNNI